MKITKRRWRKLPPVYLYRHEKQGTLVTADDHTVDRTAVLFADPLVLDTFETSMRGRLLHGSQAGRNPDADPTIEHLVFDLCAGKNLTEAIQNLRRTKCNRETAVKRIRNTLSGYGLSYPNQQGHRTRKDVLFTLMDSDDADQQSAATAELNRIQKMILAEKKNRMNHVRNSITGNHTSLRVEDGQVKPNTNRAKWLLQLLDVTAGKDHCYPIIDNMERVADLAGLAGKLEIICDANKGKPRDMADSVYRAVQEHCNKVWEACKIAQPDQLTHLQYYFQELNAYCKDAFPIRTKTNGAKLRQERLKSTAELALLLAPKHIQTSIRRSLIGKSTQMHILYGKLMEYSKDMPAFEVNSETLQRIQVAETVKKQMITAISWAVARLNYLCGFQERPSDVFGWFKEVELDKDGKISDVARRLPAFFPLSSSDTSDTKTLLMGCFHCIREVRIRIVHYKNHNLMSALEEAAVEALPEPSPERALFQSLYQRDRADLQDAFQAQIRSSNLPLYYADDLLNDVFSDFHNKFTLYSEPLQMSPSFRNVYKRGNDLVAYVPGLHWFKPDEAVALDADACRAMRKLLELCYYHLFIPAASAENGALVTRQIQAVFNRSNALAKASQNKKAVGYAEMQQLYQPNMTLKQLMELAQREISQAERENQETAEDKKDYTQRFLRDVYAAAFNEYMDVCFQNKRQEILNPKKRSEVSSAFALPELKTHLPETPTNLLLGIYPILRLLDGPELNELQQQLIRYRVHLGKELAPSIMAFEELIELVKLTEPRQAEKAEVWESMLPDLFPFVDDNNTVKSFYRQDDMMTPVLRRNLMRMHRTGLHQIYADVVPKQGTLQSYQIIQNGRWMIHTKDGDFSVVEVCHRHAQQLHEQYALRKPHLLNPAEYQSYRDMITYIQRYNHAMNAMTFTALYEISRIHLELLARWIGFAQDWERDIYFLLKAWANQEKIRMSQAEVLAIFQNGSVCKNLRKALKDADGMEVFLSIYGKSTDKLLKFIDIRNSIAHFDLLRKNGWSDANKVEMGNSIIESYIDALRQLLYYDAKRMNAVTKATQKVLQQHKMSLRFSMEKGGKLRIAQLESEPILHLAGFKINNQSKSIPVPSHSTDFDRNLLSLLRYPKKV